MNPTRRAWLAAMALVPMARLAAAEAAWPSKPIHMITGGAGSVADIRARWLGERLAPVLGQAFVVENQGAAGGNVGAAQGAHSAPDGYVLTIVHQGTLAINPHLYPKLGFDPLADFAPITPFGIGQLLLTVHPDVPARSVAELVRLAKSKPGRLNYGSPGIGTPPHLACELFKRSAGIDAVHVPYKGGGALLTDLLGGQITWSMDGLTTQLPHVKAGRLRALAVSGPKRIAALPDLPTIGETVAGYEFVGWTGIAAPAGTPRPVINRFNAEIARIGATDEARDWFASFGAEPGIATPEAFAAFIRAEHAKWGAVIRDAGIRLE